MTETRASHAISHAEHGAGRRVRSCFRAPARADQTKGHERVDFTTYTLRPGELSLGLWTEEHGILDEVTVGTYLSTWLAFPILHAPIATGYLKVRDSSHHAPRGAFTRIDADLGVVSHHRALLGNVIPGIAFSWSHVNLQLDVRHGNVWPPIVWLPTARRTVVPDASVYVRF